MSSTRPLPTLFGRLTTVYTGHEHLGATLGRLRQMCAALAADQSTALESDLAPDPLIADFLRDLSQHFAAEETEGYFGTVVAERPLFQHRILELRAEHAAMLRALSELRVIAADRRRWNEIAIPMSRLIGQLQAHERTETALLQEYFLQDDGTGAD